MEKPRNIYENLTVMIVEDDKTHRWALRQCLQAGLGVKIIECGTGRDAVDSLKKYEPNLIILDLRLPDFDGDALLNRIRKDERTRDIPVLVCTAHSERETIMRLVDLKISGCIVKPFTHDTVHEKVRAAFDQHLHIGH